MIITRELAKKLTPLVNFEVENALLLLLEAILKEKEEIFTNPDASDAQLREFKGQKSLILELKQYKSRINDSIKREKERKEDEFLHT